jgi:hypothetical protein
MKNKGRWRKQTWNSVVYQKIEKQSLVNGILKSKSFIMKHWKDAKARLVARGFTQIQGTDFEETYLQFWYRINPHILTIALSKKFPCTRSSWCGKTAFLNGELEEEIYMRLKDLKVPKVVSLFAIKKLFMDCTIKSPGLSSQSFISSVSKDSTEVCWYKLNDGKDIVYISLCRRYAHHWQ